MKIAVMAGNKGQFDYFCYECKVNPNDPKTVFKYCGEHSGITGMQFDMVILYGTFYENPGYKEIACRVKAQLKPKEGAAPVYILSDDYSRERLFIDAFKAGRG